MQRTTGFARDLELLDVLATAISRTGEGLRLSEVAAVSGREKSQVSRAFARLDAAGLIARDPHTRQFRLGPKLYHLAALTAEANMVRTVRPVMRQLVASLAETVHLCVLRGSVVRTLYSEAPAHGFRGLGWTGSEQPAHSLSAGRVLLAEMDESTLNGLYPRGVLPDLQPNAKVRTVAHLLAECAIIRRRGFAVVHEEFEAGLVGASAALWDFRGIAVASLNVAAPVTRLGSKLDAVGNRLRKETQQLSMSLGADARRGAGPVIRTLGF
jgi:DNA-binding IclR family transcriptional regulator